MLRNNKLECLAMASAIIKGLPEIFLCGNQADVWPVQSDFMANYQDIHDLKKWRQYMVAILQKALESLK